MVNSYVWSPVYVDALIARDSSGTRLYAMQEAGWKVVGLVNTFGTTVERYAYDVYGSQTVMDGSWNSRTNSNYNWVYGFQGLRLDAVSGDYNARNRELSPTLEQWLQPDPSGFAGQDVNLARFESNNPISSLDPDGLQPAQPGPQGPTVGDVIGGIIGIAGGKPALWAAGKALGGAGGGGGGGGAAGGGVAGGVPGAGLANPCQGQVLKLDKVKVTKITFGKARLLRVPADLDVSDFSALAGTSVTNTADYLKAIQAANDKLLTILVRVVPDDPFTADGFSDEIWPEGGASMLECEIKQDSKKDLGIVKKDVPVTIYITVRKQSDNQKRDIALESTFSVEGQGYSYDLQRRLKDPFRPK